MSIEKELLGKLRRLPKRERERLLQWIDEWIAENAMPQPEDVRQAVAAVESTWASLALDPATLRWVAEEKGLEYDLGRTPRRR